MKRYVPQQPQDKPDISIAKARLRVAAIQAGPSVLVRRHPWSAVIGTAASTFALTAIAKLFLGGSRSGDESDDAPDKRRPKRGPSAGSTILQSVMSMGLPIIQSQLTKHFLNRTHEQHQQKPYAETPGDQEPAHAVG